LSFFGNYDKARYNRINKGVRMDKAILVSYHEFESIETLKASLDELESLALTLNIETRHKVIQRGTKASARTLIGSGKVSEIKRLLSLEPIDVVIFDDTLSPAQLRNLESDLDCQVFDRSFLILSIFALRAKSKEATLEVSLAQKKYMISRLHGLSASLSRQGGGSYNAKGPGETQLELDRRKILTDISHIKDQLKKIKIEKQTSRKLRESSAIKTVALVGYTNAGKSSLMNLMLRHYGEKEHQTLEQNLLFSTIDTKAKKLNINDYPPMILIDTVGFIQKLPTELVASFETTLEDTLNADLLLHVIDGAHFNMSQVLTTRSLLKKLGAEETPVLHVLTKKDLASDIPYFDEDYAWVSSVTSEGLDDFIKKMYYMLYAEYQTYDMIIPFEDMKWYHHLQNHFRVIESNYIETGVHIKVFMDPKQSIHFQQYIQ
jgi:GTPase